MFVSEPGAFSALVWFIYTNIYIAIMLRSMPKEKKIGLRSPEQHGLGLLEKLVMKKQSDPMDQRTRLYHNVLW